MLRVVEVIENTKEARNEYGWLWGGDDVIITKKDIEELLNGKCLAWDNDEYVTFVSLGENDDNN